MQNKSVNGSSAVWVILSFAIVYIVWGSTYFFIKMAVQGFPPMMLGAIRFLIAGLLLLGWCAIKGDRLWVRRDIITSLVTGLLLLFVATGIVIWAERTLASAMVAIMVSANPIWVTILDKTNWKTNLSSRTTVSGLVLGFVGVILLFGEAIVGSLSGGLAHAQLYALLILLGAPIAWASGSIFSKRRGSSSPARVNTAWQMIFSGLAFIPVIFLNNEWTGFQLNRVPAASWFAMGYLILFGSIAAFSAYVWLLKVRPATQVSTHSYVNPVIAVILGVVFGNESISVFQIAGLVVILVSVLLINLLKYSPAKKISGTTGIVESQTSKSSRRECFPDSQSRLSCG